VNVVSEVQIEELQDMTSISQSSTSEVRETNTGLVSAFEGNAGDTRIAIGLYLTPIL
jgi:hypothetical protein